MSSQLLAFGVLLRLTGSYTCGVGAEYTQMNDFTDLVLQVWERGTYLQEGT